LGKFTLFAVLFPLLLGVITRATSFLHFRGIGLRIQLGSLLVTLAALIPHGSIRGLREGLWFVRFG
jgi:hypothetical protein